MTALAKRLTALGIDAPTLAAIVRRPLADVERWISARSLGGEAAVLLRFLADADDARRRAAQVRRTYRRNYATEDPLTRTVRIPYGTADAGKLTGGRPS
jgi:hypothetical protein